MGKFAYTANQNTGKSLSGSIEASSRASAQAILQKQGLQIVSLKEEKTGFDLNNLHLPKSGKVKLKDLVVFTRQLSTMVNAGVPLVRALATLEAQTESETMKEALVAITKEVEGGNALADALKKHPKIFSEVYVNMVSAGEAGGILDDILKRLATQQEKDASIRKKIKSASAYPMVLMFITVTAFFGLMIFVVPKIGGIITDLGGPDAKLPVYTQAMLGISDFMVHNFIVMAVMIAAVIFVTKRYISTPKGKLNFHRLLLRLPVVKTVITKVAIARFSRTFASLMTSGVAVLDALQVTGGAIGNLVIQNELKRAAQEVKNGHQLSEPLSQSAIFPPIVAQMLAIGEETGQIDTILIKVADFYEEEVDVVIDSLASIIEPVMIVIMGAMVGLIAASVMGPIASLSQNISGFMHLFFLG